MNHTVIYNPRSLDAVLATSAFLASAPTNVELPTLVPFDRAAHTPATDYVTMIDVPWNAFRVSPLLSAYHTARQITVYSNRPACIKSWLGPRYVGSHKNYEWSADNVRFYGVSGLLCQQWHELETCPAFAASLTLEGNFKEEFAAWVRSLPLHAGYLPQLWKDLQAMTADEMIQLLVTVGPSLLRAEDAAIVYNLQHASSRLCLSPRNGWSRINGRAVMASPLALEQTAQSALAFLPDAEAVVAYCVYGRRVDGVVATRSAEMLNRLPVNPLSRSLGEFSVSVEQFFSYWAA